MLVPPIPQTKTGNGWTGRGLFHIDPGEILEPALRAHKAFDVLGHRPRIEVMHDK